MRGTVNAPEYLSSCPEFFGEGVSVHLWKLENSSLPGDAENSDRE
jgi:hypothetical protein